VGVVWWASDAKTKGISDWSDWPTKDNLEHPEQEVELVRTLLVDLGYDPEVAEDPEESHPEEVPSFYELIEVLLRIPEKVSSESMQLVLVSRATGLAQFVTLDENPTLRRDVQKALESTSVPLGVIAWTSEVGGLTGSKMVFPWVKQDPVAVEVFDRICEEAGKNVGEVLRRRRIH